MAVFPVHRSRSLLHRILRHIIIDETSTGREAWTAIENAMAVHLLKRLFMIRRDLPSAKIRHSN